MVPMHRRDGLLQLSLKLPLCALLLCPSYGWVCGVAAASSFLAPGLRAVQNLQTSRQWGHRMLRSTIRLQGQIM